MQAFFLTTYPNISLNIIIPGSDISISDWPIYSNTVFCISLKIQVTPSVTLSSPHDGTSAHMVTPHPIEALNFSVRLFRIFNKKVFGRFFYGITCSRLVEIMLFHFSFWYIVPIRQFPGIERGCWIIYYVFDIPTPFEDERFKSLFTEFFGGKTSTNPRSDDNGIISDFFFTFSVYVHCCFMKIY